MAQWLEHGTDDRKVPDSNPALKLAQVHLLHIVCVFQNRHYKPFYAAPMPGKVKDQTQGTNKKL